MWAYCNAKIINYEKIVEIISNVSYNMKIHVVITMMAIMMVDIKMKMIKVMW